MLLAPITLFVYNRLSHTQRTVEALQRNSLASQSNLLFFSDGPKNDDISRKQVKEVRDYLYTVSGFQSVQIVERSENDGLANSIIQGVTEAINKYGQAIVLEDDMITSVYFLEFMNKALNIYQTNQDVISIHAYIYPVKQVLPETFFLRGADCWGWATWKRGWDLFQPDGQKLLKELESKKLTREFDFSDSYPYTQMLRDQINGKNNSWAIRWYASAFLQNKLTLYPGRSLVNNVGFDGSGTHCSSLNKINDQPEVQNTRLLLERINIQEDNFSRQIIIKYFRHQTNFLFKIMRYFKKIFK